jgi:hypothetical protein
LGFTGRTPFGAIAASIRDGEKGVELDPGMRRSLLVSRIFEPFLPGLLHFLVL